MEQKLNDLIDIIKLIVEIDCGISKENSDWILAELEDLKNERDC